MKTLRSHTTVTMEKCLFIILQANIVGNRANITKVNDSGPDFFDNNIEIPHSNLSLLFFHLSFIISRISYDHPLVCKDKVERQKIA